MACRTGPAFHYPNANRNRILFKLHKFHGMLPKFFSRMQIPNLYQIADRTPIKKPLRRIWVFLCRSYGYIFSLV